MTRLRTYDPLLGDCRKLRQLAEPDYQEHSLAMLLLIAALAAVLVVLGWAAWTTEIQIGEGPRGDLSRGGGMPAVPVVDPMATTGTLRGSSLRPVEAGEIPRAGGEVGAAWPIDQPRGEDRW